MTALHLAIQKNNVEIVKTLLTNDKLDINAFCILIDILNNIHHQIFQKYFIK